MSLECLYCSNHRLSGSVFCDVCMSVCESLGCQNKRVYPFTFCLRCKEMCVTCSNKALFNWECASCLSVDMPKPKRSRQMCLSVCKRMRVPGKDFCNKCDTKKCYNCNNVTNCEYCNLCSSCTKKCVCINFCDTNHCNNERLIGSIYCLFCYNARVPQKRLSKGCNNCFTFSVSNKCPRCRNKVCVNDCSKKCMGIRNSLVCDNTCKEKELLCNECRETIDISINKSNRCHTYGCMSLAFGSSFLCLECTNVCIVNGCSRIREKYSYYCVICNRVCKCGMVVRPKLYKGFRCILCKNTSSSVYCERCRLICTNNNCLKPRILSSLYCTDCDRKCMTCNKTRLIGLPLCSSCSRNANNKT